MLGELRVKQERLIMVEARSRTEMDLNRPKL